MIAWWWRVSIGLRWAWLLVAYPMNMLGRALVAVFDPEAHPARLLVVLAGVLFALGWLHTAAGH